MFAVIRLRGKVGMRKEMEDTLNMLRLKNVNNCVLIPESEDFKGMLNKVKDYTTWGEIDKETLVKMLEKRLRLVGKKRVDEKVLKEVTGFDSFEKMAENLIEGKVKLKDFKNIDVVIRLTPPSKGFESIKDHYPKGDLGYRGREINELLGRMI
ncbi:50S ribosomal protein L30 [archaeon]|nr:50S ribosomal protein L30 [archaeon]